MLIGPFIHHGISCDDESFFKKANNQYTKASQDVSEYNINQFLTSIKSLDTKIHFLSPNPSEVFKKEKFKGMFDDIYVSANYAQYAPDCSTLLKESGKIHVEHANLSIEAKDEHVKMYKEKIHEIVKATGLVSCKVDDFFDCYYINFEKPVKSD
jgi:hypothetical protein